MAACLLDLRTFKKQAIPLRNTFSNLYNCIQHLNTYFSIYNSSNCKSKKDCNKNISRKSNLWLRYFKTKIIRNTMARHIFTYSKTNGKSTERVYTRGQYSKSANSNCEFVVLPFKLDSLCFRGWKHVLESGTTIESDRVRHESSLQFV